MFITKFHEALVTLRGLRALTKGGYLSERGWFRSYIEKSPVDREKNIIPWLPYPAADFIESRLHKGLCIFEYGSGSSTMWFSKRCKKIVSCEHDRAWYKKIKDQIPDNATIIYKKPGKDYIEAIKNFSHVFDIILIDGIDRVQCMENCLEALKKDGIIILDDSFRKEYNQGLEYLINNGF
ncbi:MAG: class I SAM-dependent methyltransferase [Lentisphaerae bacterium]|nr:class I SAM-dependent methyltransferase [Lentisphaerota bacterium]MCP4100698.1 class I SAM-dependent methyltransferase [Lentisphaerota bacterium]